jgi:hypothetical protein
MKPTRPNPTDIIGVTVSTPSYRHLEKDAVSRFKKHSGLKVKVIRRRTDVEGFRAKLQLDLEVGQKRIVFFDLDWWALNTLDFIAWDGRELMAVHDPAVFHPDSFCHKDCFEGPARLDQLRYFNTGFFAVDFRRPEMRKVFEIARRTEQDVLAGKREKPSDHTDQYYINHGALAAGIPVKYLPASYNYYDKAALWGFIPHRPRFVVGLHAAGEKVGDKLSALKAQETIWGRAHSPVRPESLLYQHVMCHEVR